MNVLRCDQCQREHGGSLQPRWYKLEMNDPYGPALERFGQTYDGPYDLCSIKCVGECASAHDRQGTDTGPS